MPAGKFPDSESRNKSKATLDFMINLFHKKAKLLANRTSQGNFHLLPLLPPSSLERFFELIFLACTMFSLLGVSGQLSFHFISALLA